MNIVSQTFSTYRHTTSFQIQSRHGANHFKNPWHRMCSFQKLRRHRFRQSKRTTIEQHSTDTCRSVIKDGRDGAALQHVGAVDAVVSSVDGIRANGTDGRFLFVLHG